MGHLRSGSVTMCSAGRFEDGSFQTQSEHMFWKVVFVCTLCCVFFFRRPFFDLNCKCPSASDCGISMPEEQKTDRCPGPRVRLRVPVPCFQRELARLDARNRVPAGARRPGTGADVPLAQMYRRQQAGLKLAADQGTSTAGMRRRHGLQGQPVVNDRGIKRRRCFPRT